MPDSAVLPETTRKRYSLLKLEGQAEPLKPTDRHCLFSITQNAWVPTSQLQAGKELRTLQGSTRITSISALPGMFRVYNLEVEGDHSYLAGNAQVLSHNVNSCIQRGPKGGKKHTPGNHANDSKSAKQNKKNFQKKAAKARQEAEQKHRDATEAWKNMSPAAQKLRPELNPDNFLP